MSKQYPGGIISKNPVVPSGPYSNDTASGIWTLDQQAYWQKLGQWPTAGNFPKDAQFNQVTMLLHGDGTNGAQNNTFLDSGPNTLSITRNGNTTQGSFSPYGSNWSNYFDGTGDYLSISTNANFNASNGDFTVEAWVYQTVRNATSCTLFTLRNADSATFADPGINSDGALQCWNLSGGFGSASTSTVSLFQWTHIAFVRSSNVLYYYINGVQSGSTTMTNTWTGTTPKIGGQGWNANFMFNGYISNFRYTKSAVYTANFTPSTTPLAAITNTQILTCQSNRFIDNSASVYTITVNGNPSVQRFNPFGTSTAYSTSVIGGSGYFDGTGDYLNTANSSAFAFGTGDFTVECWINTGSNNVGLAEVDGGSTGYWMWHINAGTMSWQNTRGGSNLFLITGAGAVCDNAWHHLAIVRNSSVTKAYWDGVEKASASDTTNYSGTGGNLNVAYESAAGKILNGYMANFRIVKGTAVYTAAFTPPTAPLTAVTNTSILLNTVNAGIYDNAMMNDLETVGNAQISTSVVKYGTGSMYFDGTGDYLYSAKFVPFGTGNFTIECWVYPLTTAERPIFYQFPYESYGIGFGINGPSAGKLYFYSQSLISSSTAPVVTGAWQHIACVKSGGTITLYYNGTSVASGAFNQNHIVANMYIAADPQQSGVYYNGYVDDIRITNGYARYTANFTPPAQAFFDYGPT